MNVLSRMLKTEHQKSQFRHRRPATMALLFSHFACCILMLLGTGCQKPDEGTPLVVQMEQLTQQNRLLREQIEQSKTENRELEERVEVLSALPGDARGENIYSIEQIRISRLSGFFDKDKDGKREKLIVYITPIDKQGDGIKAAGAANVQLWDLNKADGEALLGEWNVGPDELKNAWFKTVLAVNYRLVFDIPEAVDNFGEQLTARITFTDHLSGKVFKDQRVIQPR